MESRMGKEESRTISKIDKSTDTKVRFLPKT